MNGKKLVAATIACLAAFVATAHRGFAAELSGTVINKNTQKFLERASVIVEGTTFQALTDSQGNFRITGIPAGSYKIVASYTDLNPETTSVAVTEGAPATANFALASEIYKMGEFVVTSAAEGNAFAVNQQRRAESARVVTSVDAFIDQTTGNPGEFLKSVEGIQMDYSQNEPQQIRVRGFDPNLTMVTMDGNEIASAASSSANRSVQIDQLSIASIESVEVYKAPIPSMSANAIGGAVNFITKSAFDQKGRRAFAQVGVNMDSNDFSFRKSPGPGHGETAERRIYPVGRVEYSNSFFENRVGVLFSVGYDHTNQLGSSTTNNLNVTALPGGTLPAAPTLYTLDNVTVRRGAFSIAPNRQLRVRADISLNTDFKFSNTLSGYLKTSYAYYHSTNRNHGLNLTPGALAAGDTVTSYTTTAGTVTQTTSIFDKYTRSSQFSPGLKFRSGDWKIDLDGGYSKSTNHYKNPHDFTSVNLQIPTTVGYSMTTPLTTDVPTSITQNTGADIYDLNSYRPNQTAPAGGILLANSSNFVANNHRDTWDGKYSGRLDVQRDFQTRFPFYLKAGLAYNETIFDKTQSQRRWYYAGDDGVIGTADDTLTGTVATNMARFAEPVPVTQNIPGWTLREPTYFSAHEFYSYWESHPQILVENAAYAAQQRIVGRQKVNEKVRAGYIMANATVMKLNVLAGVRVEETDIKALGYRVLPTSGATSVLPAGVNANSLEGILASYRFFPTSSNYRSTPFPYLHLKYEWLPGLQTRGSYTEGIGRPNLTDVLPNNVTQNDVTQTISTNRAGLLPQRSKNWDFSVEYYSKAAGQLTASWFNRKIKDFISTATIPMTPELLTELGLGPEFANYQVTTKTNLGQATQTGYELSFQQSLRQWSFVPQFLQGVTLKANYTNIYKMSGDFGTPGATITQLANVVPKLVNGGISYRTPSGLLQVNLTANYQSARTTANLPATAAAAQRAPRQEAYRFWNMDVSYRLTSNLRLSATARNLFSERPKFSEVGIIRNTQQATGIAWLFAAKYDL